MGATQSIPSTLTREKVYELTKSTRNVMDILMDYMLKEITVRDFMALSNPAECKKYVIFMANTLHKYFYELQIVPIKDKKGVIAFRPVKDLVNPPEEAESDRQSLCLTLAYFYTRIFQIYGALALTLIDDSKYMIESGIIPIFGDTTKKGLLAPGYRPYSSYGGSDSVSGGALNGRTKYGYLGNFYFLNSFLYDSIIQGKGYETKYSGEGEVFFNSERLERNERGRPIITTPEGETKPQKGTFLIGYSGAKKYAYLEVQSRSGGIGTNKYIFTFGKLRYTKKDGVEATAELSTDIFPNKTLTIISTKTKPVTYMIYGQPEPKNQILEYFDDFFEKIVPYIKGLAEGTEVGTIYSKSEVDTAEQLKLSRIILNLTKTKPLGHCLARAIQLLRTLPLKGEDGVSHICKAKFFEHTVVSSSGIKTTVSRSGIPQPGESLDTSPGMSALSQLFYDTVLIGTPKIVIGDVAKDGKPSSLQQYITFMKTMAKLFGDTAYTIVPMSDDMVKAGLKIIKNKRDSELCVTPNKKSITGDIVVPKNKVGNVYDIVNQLYRTQVEHAQNCGKIFNMLFNMKQDKASGRFRISLSDNIIKNGFPEIDRINYLAREVLIKYYTTCEMKYLQGMKIVLDSSFPRAPITTP